MTGISSETLQGRADAGDPGAQLELSLLLHRQGRADQASIWLRRAAGGGHPIAQTLLGARLLTGKGERLAPHEGIGALLDAHAGGGADAAAMLAVLTGAGVGLGQSWPEAFRLLALAAQRGSPRARGQLAVLAPGGGSVDLEGWLAAPPGDALCASPHIVAFKDFISPQICDCLVERARGRLTAAEVYDAQTGAGRVEQARSNSKFQFDIVEMDLVIALVRARVEAASGFSVKVMEPPQVLHYDVGQAFEPHFDFLETRQPGHLREIGERGQRRATFLIYLNDDFDGGETDFPTLGLRYRGAKGDALLFHNTDASGEPDPRTLHAGLPPTRGKKWLYSQWIRDRPPPEVS